VITYDYEGTGIGLYASKLIVEQFGGTIDVTSKEGSGSTFTIHIPVAEHKATPESKIE
jgi:signal transduction histidine kinase